MTVVKDVAMLAADTARSRMYLQVLEREGLYPEHCVVFGTNMSTGQQTDAREGMGACGVDLAESLTKTLEPISFEARFGDSYSFVITGDSINGYKITQTE